MAAACRGVWRLVWTTGVLCYFSILDGHTNNFLSLSLSVLVSGESGGRGWGVVVLCTFSCFLPFPPLFFTPLPPTPCIPLSIHSTHSPHLLFATPASPFPNPHKLIYLKTFSLLTAPESDSPSDSETGSPRRKFLKAQMTQAGTLAGWKDGGWQDGVDRMEGMDRWDRVGSGWTDSANSREISLGLRGKKKDFLTWQLWELA